MYLETVLENLKLSENSKELIINNINKIVNNNVDQNVGIVYGKVQSGKTRNLIGLSANFFDKDINLVVFLFSDTKILLGQNLDRFKEAYSNLIEDDEVILMNTDELNPNTISNELLKFYSKNNKKIIICALKNRTHIDRIIQTFSNTPYAHSKSIIIDDEGDDITQNSAKVKFDGSGFEINHSSVNGKLIELKNSLNSGLISVTATPYANLLLQPTQELAPSWCEVLETSPDYTGLDSFYEDPFLVEVINEDAKDFVKKSGVPNSFLYALAYYITAVTILNKNSTKTIRTQMLIHPDKRVITHANITTKIKDLIKYFFLNESYRKEVNSLFNSCFNEIKSRNFENSKINVGDFNDYEFEDFSSSLRFTYTLQLNAKSDLATKDIKKLIKENLPSLIFVGGDLLDRGITFPDLLVTYIFRESKKMQEDTMLQRARWLGYRKDILSFSKVFLTQNLYDFYKEIVLNTNHLNEMLEFYSKKKDLDLREVDFRLRLKDIYNPTSKSKATWESNSTSWYVQSSPNIKSIGENLSIFDNYISNLNSASKLFMNSKFEISFEEFEKLVDDFKFDEADEKINIFKKFIKELNLDSNTKIDLVLMRDGNYEERSLNKEKNQINNLLQGQSTKSKDIYPGDRYLLNENIMVQLHLVRLKDNLINKNGEFLERGSITPMIAVGIPYRYREENFIQRKKLF